MKFYNAYLLLSNERVSGKTRLFILFTCLLFIGASCSVPRYETHPVSISIQSGAGQISRGKALVTLMCADCHRDPVTGVLSGKPLTDVPKVVGKLYSRNITQHSQKGLGQYTDGELAFLLRTGINRTGHLSPIMAKPALSDEDLKAVIAFLKHSVDPMLKPTDAPTVLSRYSLPAKVGMRVLVKPFAYPVQSVASPPVSDPVAHGRYLVNILGCYECHSKSMASVDKLNPEQSKGYLAGGMKLKTLTGTSIQVPNLTMDTATGIGNWTKADFVTAIRDGVRPDHTVLQYPMPNYGALSTQEAEAMYAYIQKLPAIKNKVKRTIGQQKITKPTASADSLAIGKQLYVQYGCQSCHGESGIGIADLRKAYQKYPDNQALKARIENPTTFYPETRMPKFQGIVEEKDFAPLLAYVRWLGKTYQVK